MQRKRWRGIHSNQLQKQETLASLMKSLTSDQLTSQLQSDAAMICDRGALLSSRSFNHVRVIAERLCCWPYHDCCVCLRLSSVRGAMLHKLCLQKFAANDITLFTTVHLTVCTRIIMFSHLTAVRLRLWLPWKWLDRRGFPKLH